MKANCFQHDYPAATGVNTAGQRMPGLHKISGFQLNNFPGLSIFLYGEEGSWEGGGRREEIMKSWRDSEKRGIEGEWFCSFCFALTRDVGDILCSLAWFAVLTGACLLFLEILLSASLFFVTAGIFAWVKFLIVARKMKSKTMPKLCDCCSG